ncbi:MAG: MBL fold metallo-hydrolase [Planctomycetia bacterium]|nr:MBL fold metallo-hydrolase [Planctomycetia bacterium]
MNELKPGEILFLGTGTSHGVPKIGCECDVCQSSNPKNKRTRSSIIFRAKYGSILIDTTPDMRTQFIRERLAYADAILLTHSHFDHLFGLDDTRRFFDLNGQKRVPIYCSFGVSRDVHTCFAYIFDPAMRGYGGGIPRIDIKILRRYRLVEILGMPILPVVLRHGKKPVFGYRFGNVAYCTDAKSIPSKSMDCLRDLDTLILGCLRYRPHPTHFSLDEALEVVKELKPKRTFFTHLDHEFEHERLEAELPNNIRPAYDGLRLFQSPCEMD